MKKPVPYRLKFSFFFCCVLLLRLLPYYLYHFIRRPYRKDVSVIAYKSPHVGTLRRARDALFDAMFQVLLSGYCELTGLKVLSSTGQMLFFLSSLLAAFDQCFEVRLKAGDSLEFRQVLEESLVQEEMNIFRHYLQLFDRAEPIVEYLRSVFTEHYTTYIRSLQKAQSDLQFEDVLASVHLDSGIELRCLMEVAGLFNEHRMDEEVRYQFYLFGMVGKFADDMVDIVRDIAEASPNLLYTLLRQNPSELKLLSAAIEKRQRLHARWWQKHCPQTYTRYFEYVEEYYGQIHSGMLRLACDLTMLPAIVGYDYDAARWETQKGEHNG